MICKQRSLLLSVLFLASSIVFSMQLSKIKVRYDGHYVDKDGRVRIFHGFNAVNKGFPWYPPELLNVSLVQHYKEWGFNVVRLGTMWSGAQPEKEGFNETYLEILGDEIKLLADNDLYVFLDMHQDVLSKRFGTYDGAPAWLVDMLPKAKHPYPWPFKAPYHGDWAKQYLTEDCCVAFQGLYDNINHSLEYLAGFWKKIAATFKDCSSVLGYELMNEPWAGDVWHDPRLFLPGHAGYHNLMPMYDKIAQAIREVDNETIIMYEPVTWGIWFNGEAGTGFTSVPGGREYSDRSALSYHLYCWIKTGDSDPLSFLDKVVCDDVLARDVMSNARKEFRRTGGGGFLTEFGECQPDGRKNSSNTVLCETVLDLADEHLASWTYWDTDFLNKKTGHIQWDIVKPFIRAYPRAVAGTPIALSWNYDSHSMQFDFLIDPTIKEPTEIFIPPIWFSEGMIVSTSDILSYTYEKEQNILLVVPKNSVKESKKARVFVTPRYKQ